MPEAPRRLWDDPDEWDWIMSGLRTRVGPEMGEFEAELYDSNDEEQVDEESESTTPTTQLGPVVDTPAVRNTEPAPSEYDEEGISDTSTSQTLASTNLSTTSVDYTVEVVSTPMQYMDGVAYRPGNAFSIMTARRFIAAREQDAAGIERPSEESEPTVAAGGALGSTSVEDMDWLRELPSCPHVDGADEELASLNQAYSDLNSVLQQALAEETEEAE